MTRGLLDRPDALYAPERVAAFAERMPALRVTQVAGRNHCTIVLTDAGAPRPTPRHPSRIADEEVTR